MIVWLKWLRTRSCMQLAENYRSNKTTFSKDKSWFPQRTIITIPQNSEAPAHATPMLCMDDLIPEALNYYRTEPRPWCPSYLRHTCYVVSLTPESNEGVNAKQEWFKMESRPQNADWNKLFTFWCIYCMRMLLYATTGSKLGNTVVNLKRYPFFF